MPNHNISYDCTGGLDYEAIFSGINFFGGGFNHRRHRRLAFSAVTGFGFFPALDIGIFSGFIGHLAFRKIYYFRLGKTHQGIINLRLATCDWGTGATGDFVSAVGVMP